MPTLDRRRFVALSAGAATRVNLGDGDFDAELPARGEQRVDALDRLRRAHQITRHDQQERDTTLA